MAVSSAWPSSAADAQPSAPSALTLRIPLPPVAQLPPERAPAACPRCGSRGFNVHQRLWKQVRDPDLARALVLRYLCKRCGYASRVYPTGIGRGQQSAATVAIARLLTHAGVSGRAIAGLLSALGCPLSASGVRKNLTDADGVEPVPRLNLSPVGGTTLRGYDGGMTIRVHGRSTDARWLEIEVEPGPQAALLHAHLVERLHSHQEVRTAPVGR